MPDKRLVARVPSHLHAVTKTVAAARGETVSAFVEDALRRRLSAIGCASPTSTRERPERPEVDK